MDLQRDVKFSISVKNGWFRGTIYEKCEWQGKG